MKEVGSPQSLEAGEEEKSLLVAFCSCQFVVITSDGVNETILVNGTTPAAVNVSSTNLMNLVWNTPFIPANTRWVWGNNTLSIPENESIILTEPFFLKCNTPITLRAQADNSFQAFINPTNVWTRFDRKYLECYLSSDFYCCPGQTEPLRKQPDCVQC